MKITGEIIIKACLDRGFVYNLITVKVGNRMVGKKCNMRRIKCEKKLSPK